MGEFSLCFFREKLKELFRDRAVEHQVAIVELNGLDGLPALESGLRSRRMGRRGKVGWIVLVRVVGERLVVVIIARLVVVVQRVRLVVGRRLVGLVVVGIVMSLGINGRGMDARLAPGSVCPVGVRKVIDRVLRPLAFCHPTRPRFDLTVGCDCNRSSTGQSGMSVCP